MPWQAGKNHRLSLDDSIKALQPGRRGGMRVVNKGGVGTGACLPSGAGGSQNDLRSLTAVYLERIFWNPVTIEGGVLSCRSPRA